MHANAVGRTATTNQIEHTVSHTIGITKDTRPSLSQIWSFKISRTTFLVYIQISDFMILRLQNCERAGRVLKSIVAIKTIQKVCQPPIPREALTTPEIVLSS